MTPVEEIKSKLDAVSFIQGYLKLTRAGINFKARCPFHAEKTPSFFVSPGRETWKCFGCGKGGDIFTFVMEMEGMDFAEALRMLADRVGVKLTPQDIKAKSERAHLITLLEDTAKFFEENLANNSAAKDYLKSRGLLEKTISEFRLGFAPNAWTSLYEYLKKRGYREDEMEKSGLVIKRGGASYYDRFRSRIIFPLIDTAGRVIGFGGRIFGTEAFEGEPTSGGKYINSPQTIFYDKSRFLYALDKARFEMRKANKTVVVEGYMDAIMAWQAGTKNTVATSGTALTQEHIRAIKRFSDEVIFAFDKDRAGIEASRKAAVLSAEEGIHSFFIELLDQKDPADLIKESRERWLNQINAAQESIAFFLARAEERYSANDALSKHRISEEVLPLVAKLSSDIERAHWVRAIAKTLNLHEGACWKELMKYQKGEEASSSVALKDTAPAISRRGRLEERILGLLFYKPALALAVPFLPKKEECVLTYTGEMFSRITHLLRNKTALEELEPELRSHASRIAFEMEMVANAISDYNAELILSLKAWRAEYFRDKLRELEKRLKEAKASDNNASEKTILQEMQEIISQINS